MLPRRAHQRPKNLVRDAAAAFIRGTSFGWGKRELATWLVCHYSPSLAVDAAALPNECPEVASSGAASSLDEESVERVILEARTTTLRLLAELSWPSQRVSLARRAIASGAVVELGSSLGERSWAPVGRGRMRLMNRVGSLFLADALNHPFDYRSLSLCRECGELGFSVAVAHDEWCERARRVA
jgi:hypothetical protein